MKKRPVAEGLKDESRFHATDHGANLRTSRVEAEVFEDDEAPERDQIPLATAPATVGILASQQLGSPAFRGNARTLGCNLGRIGIGEVSQHLPADSRIGIEKPPKVRGPWFVIVQTHGDILLLARASILCPAVNFEDAFPVALSQAQQDVAPAWIQASAPPALALGLHAEQAPQDAFPSQA